jgi:hypothetical protein
MMIPVPFLLFARAFIIGWVTLALVPVEAVFDAVEADLERQGVEP